MYLLDQGEGDQAADANDANLCCPTRNASRQDVGHRVSHSVPCARNSCKPAMHATSDVDTAAKERAVMHKDVCCDFDQEASFLTEPADTPSTLRFRSALGAVNPLLGTFWRAERTKREGANARHGPQLQTA